jgi:hypothetical protein
MKELRNNSKYQRGHGISFNGSTKWYNGELRGACSSLVGNNEITINLTVTWLEEQIYFYKIAVGNR